MCSENHCNETTQGNTNLFRYAVYFRTVCRLLMFLHFFFFFLTLIYFQLYLLLPSRAGHYCWARQVNTLLFFSQSPRERSKRLTQSCGHLGVESSYCRGKHALEARHNLRDTWTQIKISTRSGVFGKAFVHRFWTIKSFFFKNACYVSVISTCGYYKLVTYDHGYMFLFDDNALLI